MSEIFDTRRCELGEGPLWHPLRSQLFWFDITAGRLHSRDAAGPQTWAFDECVSAAGWTGENTLMMASESALWHLDLTSGARTHICPLEAENPETRSNDGRADPQGGFWIGTMGKAAQPGAGAIWRWHRGELRQLFGGITIPNAICFDPAGEYACFTDTPSRVIMRQRLGPGGWPLGAPSPFLDLRAQGLNPDGAVYDAEGTLWLALWGAGQVAGFDPDGRQIARVRFDAPHTSCPAFGGSDLSTLYCTSALEGMDDDARAHWPHAGMTLAAKDISRGLAEHRVIV